MKYAIALFASAAVAMAHGDCWDHAPLCSDAWYRPAHVHVREPVKYVAHSHGHGRYGKGRAVGHNHGHGHGYGYGGHGYGFGGYRW